MLIRFICENFKSFREKTEFSMIASKIVRHADHVVEKNGKRILCGAYIFGANAGGKSNFIKAIDFARRIILNGLERVDCSRKCFLLFPKGQENQIGMFQFDILVKGKFYSYGFAINYLQPEIEAEWLYEYDSAGKEKCLFSRCKNETGETVIDSEISLSREEQNRFDVYKDDFSSPGMNKTLFLRDVAKRSNKYHSFANTFLDVVLWFQNLLVIFPESHFSGIPSFSVNELSRSTYSQWLKHFDTGIDSLVAENVSTEKFWENIPRELCENIKNNLFSDFTVNPQPVVVSLLINGINYYLAKENGEITIRKILSDHGRSDVLFERHDESDGTRRLFDLLPLLQLQQTGKVIVIDELDRSLHTKVTLEFLRLFYDLNTAGNSQIIVTTHDGNLLDLDTLRQDEIWFVERDETKASTLFSLSKFKARFDNDIRKGYLLGRYGALPIFSNLSPLNQEAETDD